MSIASVLRILHRIRGIEVPSLLCAALILGIAASDARADFIGMYAPEKFTLTNHGGGFSTIDGVDVPSANGFVVFAPDFRSLVLTGTNDGSGYEGYTDLTVTSAGTGFLRFNFLFNTQDDPIAQYAGYLLGSTFVPLQDSDGNMLSSGSVTVAVTTGESIGFRAGGDNQGGIPGILTISDFAAPVPEPGSYQLFLIATAIIGAAKFYRQTSRRG